MKTPDEELGIAIEMFHRITLLLGAVVLFVVMCLLSSCTLSAAKWNLALGGKGAYTGRDFSVTWDNEKSFSDGAILAGVGISAMQAIKSVQATEATTRALDANRSAEVINSSNNATSLETVKATTLNPNVIPK